MSAKNTFDEICLFCGNYPKIPGGLPETDERAQRIIVQLRNLSEFVKSQIELPSGWRSVISEGTGAFPRVPWIALLPPQQEVAKGVYVALCFGKNGDGAVGGCIRSATHNVGLETIIRKKRGILPRIDVDGVKPWAKYNNCFANPKEFLKDSTTENELIDHLTQSIAFCSDYLGGTPLQKMVTAFRQQFPEFNTFANCGEAFLTNEDGYKRKAVNLFSESFRDWLAGVPDSISGTDFSARFLRLFAKAALVDKFTMIRLNDKILKSSVLLPQFQTLCHRLLAKAIKGDFPDSELDNLTSFIVEQGKEQPASTKLIPTCLLMFANPAKFIFIKPTQVDAFFKALGQDEMANQSRLTAEVYRSVLERFADIRAKLEELGPRDMIDLQSFYYVAVKYGRKAIEPESEPGAPVDECMDYLELFPEIVPAFASAITASGYCFGADLPFRFISSLTAKPYVVLTGTSGSGKTKLAELFSRWLCGNATNSLALVPVGADWTDSRNVLGFVNHIRTTKPEDETVAVPVYQSTVILDLLLAARAHATRPFFLILDEMNLSHVERYFADFLSTMESSKGELLLHREGRSLPRKLGGPADVPEVLPMPRNVFVVGTVNVDETTYMFSPKVLDRANVIEFRITNGDVDSFLRHGGGNINDIEPAPEGFAEAFLDLSLRARVVRKADDSKREPLADPAGLGDCQRTLMDVFKILESARLEFGYRTLNEVLRYVRVDFELTEDKANWKWVDCMDAQIRQKILPKLHGSKRRIEKLLIALATYCELGTSSGSAQTKFETSEVIRADKSVVKFWNSYIKLCDMIDAVRRDQFVSFIQ